MIWYDMIWYDMIWYDMIWYDMIRYDMIWYDMIWYDMIWYICDFNGHFNELCQPFFYWKGWGSQTTPQCSVWEQIQSNTSKTKSLKHYTLQRNSSSLKRADTVGLWLLQTASVDSKLKSLPVMVPWYLYSDTCWTSLSWMEVRVILPEKSTFTSFVFFMFSER